MIYKVKRIDEDLDFGCEERAKDAPVMAVVTLVDSSGEELSQIPLLAIYRWKVWK